MCIKSVSMPDFLSAEQVHVPFPFCHLLGQKETAIPLIIRDCGIYLILIIDYSIIVATLPEPTVLPPSRYFKSTFPHIFYVISSFL